jgi:hypothetical protein
MFDVIEVEIAAPHAQRVMAERLSKDDAEAFIKIAVARRGVEKHFYKAVPASTASSAVSRLRRYVQGSP